MSITPWKTQFLALVNQHRKQNQLAPLVFDMALDRAAQFKAEHMARTGIFSHDTPGIGSNEALAAKHDYKLPAGGWIGENILWGDSSGDGDVSPEDAFITWRDSPPHNENLLGPHYAACGVGGPSGNQFEGSIWGACAMELGTALVEPYATGNSNNISQEPRTREPRTREPRHVRLPNEPPRQEHRLGKEQGRRQTPGQNRPRSWLSKLLWDR